MVLVTCAAIVVGSLAAFRAGGFFNRLSSVITLIGASVPDFQAGEHIDPLGDDCLSDIGRNDSSTFCGSYLRYLKSRTFHGDSKGEACALTSRGLNRTFTLCYRYSNILNYGADMHVMT